MPYTDDFTWVKGNHTFKFGGMYQLTIYNGFGRQCEAGCVGFSYQETGVPGGTNPNAGGNAFASFLLGDADSAQIDTVRFIGQNFNYFAGFAQDDWRVSPQARAESRRSLGWQSAAGRFEQRVGQFLADHAESGREQYSWRCRVRRYRPGPDRQSGLHRHVALGLRTAHWSGLLWDQKTVIRASYSRSYRCAAIRQRIRPQRRLHSDPDLQQQFGGVTPDLYARSGRSAVDRAAVHQSFGCERIQHLLVSGPETTKLPAYDNFNFSIQRQLSNSLILDVGYVGVMGEHLQAQLLQYNSLPGADLTKFGTTVNSINVLNSQVGSTLANQYGITAPFPGFAALWGTRATVAQALRPYPQYTNIDTYAGQGDHSGHSTYHSRPDQAAEALWIGSGDADFVCLLEDSDQCR